LTFSGFTTILSATLAAANIRFTPTFAYDVDPTLGSTAMAGFAEYAALYRYYRVQGSKIVCHFANKDTVQNCVVYVTPVNSDPGANYAVSVAQQYLANPNTKVGIIGPSLGRNTTVITHKTSTAAYGGSWNHNVQDNYCAPTVGGAPSNNWYWDIGILGTTVVSTGVVTLSTISIDIEFFELQNPAT